MPIPFGGPERGERLSDGTANPAGVRSPATAFKRKYVRTSARKHIDPSQILVTPREKEVIHFLAHGLSSRQIAGEMGISFHTVESFRKKLLQKFNSRTTVEMVLKAGNVLPKEFWLNQSALLALVALLAY